MNRPTPEREKGSGRRHTVYVSWNPRLVDHEGRRLAAEWKREEETKVREIRTGHLFEVTGELPEAEVRDLAERLLADPVTQTFVLSSGRDLRPPKGARRIEIWPKKGVSDPVGDTVRLGAEDIGAGKLSEARSGRFYEFRGKITVSPLKSFAKRHLYNELIQSADIH